MFLRTVSFTQAVMGTALLGTALLAHSAPPYEIVLVRGAMSESQDVFLEGPTAGASASPVGIKDVLCSDPDAVRAALGLPAGQVAAAAGQVLGGVGAVFGTMLEQAAAPPKDDPRWQAWNEYEEACGRLGTDSFTIIYSECSMNMWSDEGVLRIVLPADGGEAEMLVLGHQVGWRRWRDMTGEQKTELFDQCHADRSACYSRDGNAKLEIDEGLQPYHVDDEFRPDDDAEYRVAGIFGSRVRLERLFTGNKAEYVPKGELSELVVEPRGGQGEMLGAPVNEYFFKYEGTMNREMVQGTYSPEDYDSALGAGGQGPLPSQAIPFGEISMISEGTAWVASGAPGTHVVRDFYANFEREVVPSAESETLLGGMIGHLSGLTEHGIPLRLTQETAVRIKGLPTIGQKSSSEMTVSGVAHVLSNAEWCARGDIPAHWELVDLQDLYGPSQPTQGGAGDGITASAQSQTAGSPMPPGMAGAPGQADAAAAMAQAMAQVNAAMANMTPEQQQMMQQMGLGMGQAMGSGNPAAAEAGRGVPAEAAASEPQASSAALATGDLTQTTQNYLEALGYEPGNTDGAMDTMTTVAISQFQAEKGLEVTGKVTPQLVGILAAEVDKAGRN